MDRRHLSEGRLVGKTCWTQDLATTLGFLTSFFVTKKEPLDTSDRLWVVPNLKLTAHTAAESRPKDIVGLFLKNLNHFVKDETLEGLVDFEKGY